MKPTLTTLKSPLALGMTAVAILLGGTNIARAQTPVNPVPGVDVNASVDPWADGIVDTLAEKKMIAVQNFADGNTLMAIDQYKQGLRIVLETAGNFQNRLSWTYKMAERTYQLAERLQAVSNPSDEKQLLPIMTILEQSYDLIEKYYYSLDVQYYTPYHMYCAGRIRNVTYNIGDFERIMNAYALKQVTWFQHAFVMYTNDMGTVPRYSSKVFLLTLASVAKGLSSDLSADNDNNNPNLFPLAHGQAARSLAKLSRDIENHMAGSGIYGNDQRAVNGTYTRFLQIVATLESLRK